MRKIEFIMTTKLLLQTMDKLFEFPDLLVYLINFLTLSEIKKIIYVLKNKNARNLVKKYLYQNYSINYENIKTNDSVQDCEIINILHLDYIPENLYGFNNLKFLICYWWGSGRKNNHQNINQTFLDNEHDNEIHYCYMEYFYPVINNMKFLSNLQVLCLEVYEINKTDINKIFTNLQELVYVCYECRYNVDIIYLPPKLKYLYGSVNLNINCIHNNLIVINVSNNFNLINNYDKIKHKNLFIMEEFKKLDGINLNYYENIKIVRLNYIIYDVCLRNVEMLIIYYIDLLEIKLFLNYHKLKYLIFLDQKICDSTDIINSFKNKGLDLSLKYYSLEIGYNMQFMKVKYNNIFENELFNHVVYFI